MSTHTIICINCFFFVFSELEYISEQYVSVYIEKRKRGIQKEDLFVFLFKNGRNQLVEMKLEVFENQYEDMMMEQSRLYHQLFVYVSIHHLDHLLIYQHIHQHILLLHLHIDNHYFHDLKRNYYSNEIRFFLLFFCTIKII